MYKILLLACTRFPKDVSVSRERLRRAVMKNSGLTDELEIRKSVERGMYVAREIEGMAALHKYRVLKSRYKST
ncbi:hypothetical protein NDN08_005082 [Rhodosorus marinus]|uniref:Uncharacterized protein n=1 Tax=Rhodosorus marinus TaxID=101924 RepID=A0AAV8V0G1_9RHOD|nr:hypothetical protein NDN08_005082 [Rhodosorus marinus]